MKNLLFALAIAIIMVSINVGQETSVKETEIKVYGNCNQCKTRIEKAVKIDEVKFAKWNKTTKMLKVAFLATVSADSLEKRIAAVGHDTDHFKAPDSVYSELPKCCLYRDNGKTH